MPPPARAWFTLIRRSVDHGAATPLLRNARRSGRCAVEPGLDAAGQDAQPVGDGRADRIWLARIRTCVSVAVSRSMVTSVRMSV
ncbi:hypothetical protein GCM10020218_027770 [Dactylosporangium vinaceum]